MSVEYCPSILSYSFVIPNSSASNIERIRQIATAASWQEVGLNEVSKVISFINNDETVKINIYYTTMTVSTCMDHPSMGKTQLFRRNISFEELKIILDDPRWHSNRGYYRTNGPTISRKTSPNELRTERDDLVEYIKHLEEQVRKNKLLLNQIDSEEQKLKLLREKEQREQEQREREKREREQREREQRENERREQEERERELVRFGKSNADISPIPTSYIVCPNKFCFFGEAYIVKHRNGSITCDQIRRYDTKLYKLLQDHQFNNFSLIVTLGTRGTPTSRYYYRYSGYYEYDEYEDDEDDEDDYYYDEDDDEVELSYYCQKFNGKQFYRIRRYYSDDFDNAIRQNRLPTMVVLGKSGYYMEFSDGDTSYRGLPSGLIRVIEGGNTIHSMWLGKGLAYFVGYTDNSGRYRTSYRDLPRSVQRVCSDSNFEVRQVHYDYVSQRRLVFYNVK